MSTEIIGLFMIGAMLFAIFIGFPISFTLIFLGTVFGYWGFGQLTFYLETLQFSSAMMEQTLSAVPLFIFIGILMEHAGLMERLFTAVQLMPRGFGGRCISLCCSSPPFSRQLPASSAPQSPSLASWLQRP